MVLVASVAQLAEQLTLNFAQCFQWFCAVLFFRVLSNPDVAFVIDASSEKVRLCD